MTRSDVLTISGDVRDFRVCRHALCPSCTGTYRFLQFRLFCLWKARFFDVRVVFYRWFPKAGTSFINVPFMGEVSILAICISPFCLTFSVGWGYFRLNSYAWIGQDVLVSRPLLFLIASLYVLFDIRMINPTLVIQCTTTSVDVYASGLIQRKISIDRLIRCFSCRELHSFSQFFRLFDCPILRYPT